MASTSTTGTTTVQKKDQFMIYGCYGYTGKLTARLAVQRGMKPILAGRDRQQTEAVAKELGLEYRVFGLSNPTTIEKNIEDLFLVLHAAGPFSATSKPMVDACLRTKTHYLDITGEIDVFESIAKRRDEARAAGVILLPGTGFDVVPSDCLAKLLSEQLPDATSIEIAVGVAGDSAAVSKGTLTTMFEAMASGKSSMVRENGKIREVSMGYKTKKVRFPTADGASSKLTNCAVVAWGDVSTAYHSTGVPNIYVFFPVPQLFVLLMPIIRLAVYLLTFVPFFVRFVKYLIATFIKGPDKRTLESGVTAIVGEVRNAEGDRATCTVLTPQGYSFTADSSLRIVQKLFEMKNANKLPEGGFYTPSLLLGSGFVQECDKVKVAPVQLFPAAAAAAATTTTTK